jgi:hypothetical protein
LELFPAELSKDWKMGQGRAIPPVTAENQNSGLYDAGSKQKQAGLQGKQSRVDSVAFDFPSTTQL